ncbi:DUF1133 family protein [Vagococcus sp. WN89Y]|uniref:DUF1133 family protein n=1 Tax=Vagococcus sp. WN89Y TaxID=3457258 RepID=UPI003FCD29F8
MISHTKTNDIRYKYRLTPLESVWVQGKLRMWGRWSYIGEGRIGNMFNYLLSTKKITKTAINEALKKINESGISKSELEAFLREMLHSKYKSYLAHSSDNEALLIDRVVSSVLKDSPALIKLLHERYDGSGMSKRKIAEKIFRQRADWSYETCRRRVTMWLQMSEFILYLPMKSAFKKNKY